MTTATATASKYETLRYGLGWVKVGSLSLSDQGLTSIRPPRIARSLVFVSLPAMLRWIVKHFLQARPLGRLAPAPSAFLGFNMHPSGQYRSPSAVILNPIVRSQS